MTFKIGAIKAHRHMTHGDWQVMPHRWGALGLEGIAHVGVADDLIARIHDKQVGAIMVERRQFVLVEASQNNKFVCCNLMLSLNSRQHFQ